jgi:predicted RNase H-like HicB family nuclease
MSDKDTTPQRVIRLISRLNDDQFATVNVGVLRELIAAECTAPAPQPSKEEAEIAVDKMFKNWLSRHCFFYANKTLRASGWREIAISLYRRAATPRVTPELEIEQESDGRWIAEFNRFPGVMAYGHTPEEAIRNAAKVLIESEPASPNPFSKGYKHREGKPVSDACGEGRHAECTQDLTKCHCTFRTGHTVLHAYMNPNLACTPQVTPTPLTPEEIADACSQTRTFGWLTDNGYPTAAMSQEKGFTTFQLAPILEAYWNWRKASLDPKGD